MPAVRKKPTSTVLSQMESATVRYPKFFHPNEVKAIENDVDPEVDGEVSVLSNSIAPPQRQEERSEIRRLAAPIANNLLEDMSAPPDEQPNSARPTVPIGPPTKMVVSEYDIVSQALPQLSPLSPLSPSLAPAPQVDLVAQSFAALLELPSPRVPEMHAAPPKLLPTIVVPPVPPKKRGWGAPIAAVVAMGLAGLAVFGATTDLGQRLERGLHNMYAIHVTHSFNVSEESPEPEHSLRDELEAPPAPVRIDPDTKF